MRGQENDTVHVLWQQLTGRSEVELTLDSRMLSTALEAEAGIGARLVARIFGRLPASLLFVLVS